MSTDPRKPGEPMAVDFEHIQAHYDVGNRFYALFLDATMTYSCGKFDTPEATLEDAQRAKIDLSLAKCELRPGHRLLDVGCGWGATVLRAADRYGAHAIGLTLSRAQYEHDLALAKGRTDVEFRLEGWETFGEKVDRIVSIGAFEHFGRDKYRPFFAKCRSILPDDGILLLHTITVGKANTSWEVLQFVHFLRTEVFPGGDVPAPEAVIAPARAAGFELVHAESLRPHYTRTLECWAANLEARKAEAVEVAGEEAYARYMRYFTGCASMFRKGECNLLQFKLHVVP